MPLATTRDPETGNALFASRTASPDFYYAPFQDVPDVKPRGLSPHPEPQTPTNKKQQCIDNFLKSGYGPAGNFMANTLVPDFSAISIATNLGGWLKGEGMALLGKGVLWGAPTAYGKMLTATGQNMSAYPGLAEAGANATEAGSFWTTTGATLGDVTVFVGVEGSVFATTADAYARWTCRNVQ